MKILRRAIDLSSADMVEGVNIHYKALVVSVTLINDNHVKVRFNIPNLYNEDAIVDISQVYVVFKCNDYITVETFGV